MFVKELLRAAEKSVVSKLLSTKIAEQLPIGRAKLRIEHRRPSRWLTAPSGLRYPDPTSYETIFEQESWNLITNVGRIFLHTQGYATSGIGANGLNYMALSDDPVTETATSTVLSNEIVANGLARAQSTVTLPTGSGNQTTLSKTFTCATAPQAAQKLAMFTASSAGTMNHVLGFTERSLQIADQLIPTVTITLG